MSECFCTLCHLERLMLFDPEAVYFRSGCTLRQTAMRVYTCTEHMYSKYGSALEQDQYIVLLLASGALAVEYHFVEGSFSTR